MATVLKFNSPFNVGFFSGSAPSSLVPSLYPVAIDGHPYQIIWEKDAIEVWGAKYKTNALPLLRAQADQSNTPGEQSISPENFWRRSQENFISGSGQSKQDRGTSIATRFNTSKGIDPWTPYQFSLLNDVTNKRASANTGLQFVVCDTAVYMIDGTSVVRSTDLATWTTLTSAPASTPTSLCTDGTTVYVAYGANGVYSTTGTVLASYATGQADLVAHVKGRLMVADNTTNHALYNVTAAGAFPAALVTKGAGFTWVGFAGGQSQIYAAGYSGDKSLIYRIAIVADGTTLGAPIVAASLPDGEIVRSVAAYLGYVVVGSDLGLRFCKVESDGSLTLGALIPTSNPVLCMEGYDKFIWYGLTNYDTTSTGLGRLSPMTLTDTLTPAYASDLMATGQGIVRSVHTFNKARMFTVDGVGLFQEQLNTPVSSGNLVTGWIGYGLSDPKIALFLDLKHEPLNGTISVAFAVDGGAYQVIGTSSAQQSISPGYALQTNQVTGSEFQLKFTLTPTANVSPKLTRWTLRSYPAPTRSNQFYVPIALFPSLTVKGRSMPCDHVAELKHLRSLLASQQVISYQEGNETFQVIMSDYQWLPKGVTDKGDMFGIFFATLNQVTV